MPELICIKCGKERQVGCRMCRSCYLESKRIQAKKRHALYGRHMYLNNCVLCGISFRAARLAQNLCSSCRRKMSGTNVTNTYVYVGHNKGKIIHQHRQVAEQVLGRKLTSQECVHHIDGDVTNNCIENLLIFDRSTHAKLHRHLFTQRVITAQAVNENFENCWKPLIAPITTAWLETTGANVIKIWEIGKSAAELQK